MTSTERVRARRPRGRTAAVAAVLGVAALAAACVPPPDGGGTTTSSIPTSTTSTTIDAPDIAVSGAQFRWGFGQYAQYGVFGPWTVVPSGEDVAVARVDGSTVVDDPAEAGRPYHLAVFDGGEGAIDPVTGAGSITWDTGDITVNAYPVVYNAPGETFSDPALVVNEDGSGSVSFDVTIAGGQDMEGNPVPTVGPERVTVITFSDLSELGATALEATPDFVGRAYQPLEGAPVLADCPGEAGSWPSEFINFVPESIRLHYYSTACGGLNARKFPLPVAVDWAPSAPTITTQPVWPVGTAVGSNVNLTVTGGTPVPGAAFQWQRSADNGVTWAPVSGAILPSYTFPLTAADALAFYRVVVSNPLGSVTSAAVSAVTPVAPVITTQPAATAVVGVGESVNIDVQATGTPLPTVTWQRSTDGTTWTDQGGSTFTAPRRFRHVFENATLADDGLQLRAVLSNGAGTPVISNVVTLDVQANLNTVTVHPQDAVVLEGGQFTLASDATGRPFPSNQWEVSTDGGATFAPFDVPNSHYFNLTLNAPISWDGHVFRARITNSVGTVYSNPATLRVYPLTGAKNLRIHPGTTIDPATGGVLSLLVEGYVPPADVLGNVRLALVDTTVWQPGQPLPTTGIVTQVTLARAVLLGSNGTTTSKLTVAPGVLDPTKSYGIAVYSTVATNRFWDEWHPLTLTTP